MEKVDKSVKLAGPFREADAVGRHRGDELEPLCLPEKQGKIIVQQRFSSVKSTKEHPASLAAARFGRHVAAAPASVFGHVFPYGAEQHAACTGW